MFLPGRWEQNYGVIEFHDDEIKDRFPVSVLNIIRDFSKSGIFGNLIS